MTFILLFLPPLTAVAIHFYRFKTDDILKQVYVYSVYTVLSNLLACGFVTLFSPFKEVPFVGGGLTVRFSVRYCVLSIACSIFLSYIFIHKEKYVSVIKLPNIKSNKVRMHPLRVLLLCLGELLFLFSVLLFYANQFLLVNWAHLTTEEIILNVISPQKGAASEMVMKFVYECVFPAGLVMLVLNFIIFCKFRAKNKLIVKIKLLRGYVTETVFPFEFLKKYLILFSVVFMSVVIYQLDVNFGIIHALGNFIDQSSFIEENYVNPKTVEITFPSKKRNLIYINIESFETSFLSKEFGGAQENNLIPEATRLAIKNTWFSNNELLGGGLEVLGSNWTMASLVTQTSALPIKYMAGNESGRNGEMLPNAYALGNILEANGYTNEFMMGSFASYAGRDIYFQTHGNYDLLDIVRGRIDGVIADDYNVWWGFEDQKLYAWAKDELMRLSKEAAPFNFTLMTADTHHLDGYVCDLCINEYPDQYSNVIACASRQLYDFVTWAMQQDFYENTAIVIVGDHPSMDPRYSENVSGYNRRMMNIIINPAFATKSMTNRGASLYDMFPTTIAALGANIPGDRLGLGTNLFSDQPTIIEQYSLETVSSELRKFSAFYAETFW